MDTLASCAMSLIVTVMVGHFFPFYRKTFSCYKKYHLLGVIVNYYSENLKQYYFSDF
ncbi:UNVERIFIED_CONTAM: hypothetical protein ABID98_005647 [Brevibacillus sp. OAP136]